MLPMMADKGFSSSAMYDRAVGLLERVGLLPWLHSPAAKLSGGQQQRVAVARALAMSPLLSARCDRTIEVVDGCVNAS